MYVRLHIAHRRSLHCRTIAVVAALVCCAQLMSAQATDISGIVNKYSSVTAVLPCPNIVRVENPERFAVGDTVLLIQMKGATADTSAASYGRIVAMNRAGRFERNIVETIVGNDIQLRYRMLGPVGGVGYEAGQGVQLIYIPSYRDARVVATLTCPPWDGKTGGVLCLTVRGTLVLSANVSVDGTGFDQEDGIARTEQSAGGGGGTGAGGQGGLATAGRGGAWRPGDNNDYAVLGGGGGAQAGCGGIANGISAKSVSYGTGSNWIFMGGGGGSSDSGRAKGGRGGGIAIIDSKRIIGNGTAIISTRGLNGEPGWRGNPNVTGGGGGGAGGTLLLTALELTQIPVLVADGGAGGDARNDNTHAGAGGGGGAILLGTLNPGNLVTVSADGGVGGVGRDNPPPKGCVGLSSYNNTINESTQLFNARTFFIVNDTTVCAGTQATLRADVDGTIAWSDGAATLCTDCDTLRTTPLATTTYLAIMTYSDGCLDTASVVVTVRALPVFTLADPAPFCDSVVIEGPPGFARYEWSTGDTTATIVVRTARTMTLTVFDSLGCNASSDVTTRYRGDTVLVFETQPLTGPPLHIDSIFPGERACAVVPVRNTSDADLTILSARMARGVEISVPLAQFPIYTSPAPAGSVSASITACAGAFVPAVYTDTLYILSACGESMCVLTATVLETKAYSRCNVRVLSDGEIEVLAADARPIVADLMGRDMHVDIREIGEGAYCVRGLAAGAYILRIGNTTQLLLR